MVKYIKKFIFAILTINTSVYTIVYTEVLMMIAKVFNSGNSQAVRIPKEFHIPFSELLISKVGSSIVLTPKENKWENLEKSLLEFTGDFMNDGREQPEINSREDL